jgi:hypothetical protein
MQWNACDGVSVARAVRITEDFAHRRAECDGSDSLAWKNPVIVIGVTCALEMRPNLL